MWQLPWALPHCYFVACISSIVYARGLPRVTVKTESRGPPEKRAISADHGRCGDQAPHACRHRLSTETQPAFPNAVPLAVFLRGPYFSGFLIVIVNIIDRTELIAPEKQRAWLWPVPASKTLSHGQKQDIPGLTN
jgi:hypothetical protein